MIVTTLKVDRIENDIPIRYSETTQKTKQYLNSFYKIKLKKQQADEVFCIIPTISVQIRFLCQFLYFQ